MSKSKEGKVISLGKDCHVLYVAKIFKYVFHNFERNDQHNHQIISA